MKNLTILLLLLSLNAFSQTADTLFTISCRKPNHADTVNHVAIDPITSMVCGPTGMTITPIDTAIQARIIDLKPLLGMNTDSTMSPAQIQAWIKFAIRDRVGQNVRRITPKVISKIIRGQ